MKKCRKILAMLLVVVLAFSAFAAVPVSAAEEEESKVFYFDVKSAGWDNVVSSKNVVFAHIYRFDGTGNYPGWASNAERCTYDAETGLATYDIQAAIDKGFDLDTIGPDNEWCIIFSVKNIGCETYPVLLNSNCFGDTVYAPDVNVMYENNVDSEKQSLAVRWKNSDLEAAKTITSTGKIQGTSFAYGESDETIMAAYLIAYYNDEEKMAKVKDLFVELNVSPNDVMMCVYDAVYLNLGEEATEEEIALAEEKCMMIDAVVSPLAQVYSTEDGIYVYEVFFDGTARILSYYGEESELNIPAEIDGYPIFNIDDYAFSGNGFITSLTVPEGVVSISESAFESCVYLVDVTLPYSLTTVEAFAFSDCPEMTSVTLGENVENIGEYAFGYYYEFDEAEDCYYFTKMEDFTIYGFTGTAAEAYAVENEFEFIALDAELLIGDVDQNGILSISDATYLQRAIAEYFTLTEKQEILADANGDGLININDVTRIQRVLAEYVFD